MDKSALLSERELILFDDVNELTAKILENSPSDFFEEFVAGRQTPKFDFRKISFVAKALSDEYGIGIRSEDIIVVGSSKLGFALHDKRQELGGPLPAFRPFGENSDIDLSICCPRLFSILWHEVSNYLARSPIMPIRQRKFGDYLAYGWFRADHLPVVSDGSLNRCNSLRVVRSRVRRDYKSGHPMVNFGVFNDLAHLAIYQTRSVSMCKAKLELPL